MIIRNDDSTEYAIQDQPGYYYNTWVAGSCGCRIDNAEAPTVMPEDSWCGIRIYEGILNVNPGKQNVLDIIHTSNGPLTIVRTMEPVFSIKEANSLPDPVCRDDADENWDDFNEEEEEVEE